MIRHLVMWKLSAEDPAQKAADAAEVKNRLEALVPIIDGLERLEVTGDRGVTGGNWDLVLDSDYVDASALAAYQVHPDHVVAATFIKSVVNARACVDIEA